MNTKRLAVLIVALALCLPADLSLGIGRGGGGGGGRGGGGGAARGGGGAPRGGGGVSRGGGAPARAPSSSAPRPSVSRSASPSPQAGRSMASQRPYTPSRSTPSQISRPTGNLRASTGAINPSQTTLNRPGSTGLANRPNISAPTLAAATPGRDWATPGTARPAQPGQFDRSRLPAGQTARTAMNRPNASEVGDFLGIARPITPTARPDAGRLPGAGIADRQPARNRPTNIGDRTNNIISVKPTWSNISTERSAAVRNNWNRAIVNQPNLGRWSDLHPERSVQRDRWADNVRRDWNTNYNIYNRNWNGNIFGHDWWSRHHDLPVPGWHYWNNWNRYDYNYWWAAPTWPAVTGWFAWEAPTEVWTQPVYYDYGTGGNVTYQDNVVYVNGQQVATASEFAQSAAELATVPPPADEQQATQAEWYPLGTFAVSSNEKETTPTRIVQLAVNKQGIISGTAYNTQTDQAQAIQGQVDKDTQRVAMRLGESQDVIFETGLYDLTQEEAPVLVHFGPDKVEHYLLVRLDNPTTEIQ